jgi:hypothetical protein
MPDNGERMALRRAARMLEGDLIRTVSGILRAHQQLAQAIDQAARQACRQYDEISRQLRALQAQTQTTPIDETAAEDRPA